MRKERLFNPALFTVAVTMSLVAAQPAAAQPVAPAVKPEAAAPEIDYVNTIIWSAITGLGYDSNAFQAPRATYVDYAALPAGSNPTVTPKKKSGFFVPFEITADAAQIKSEGKVLAAITANGSIYPGGSLSNANEYNMRLSGGYENILGHREKLEDTFYAGALVGRHKQIYVDHDSGLSKTTTLTGSDISGRYTYINFGFEAEYKHRTGKIDYGLAGKYLHYNYDDPVAVSELDHGYYKLGADVTIPVARHSRLNLSFGHSVRDYANRHSRDAQGRILTANPLAKFIYNAAGASLRSRISPEWLVYLDLDHTKRADGNVSYDDYKENRFGARILYEQDRIKTRLSLHHWARDYPNGFAFDVAGQGAKNFSGNDLKFKAELAQTKNAALWAELVHDAQSATDLRYDYVRTQIMAGMSWAY